MVNRTKPISPDTQFVVVDSNKTPVTPPFYQQQLARAVLRVLSKDHGDLELNTTEAPSKTGTFYEAVNVLSRENRWLETAQKDRSYFQGLCEGWWSVLSEKPVREVASV